MEKMDFEDRDREDLDLGDLRFSAPEEEGGMPRPEPDHARIALEQINRMHAEEARRHRRKLLIWLAVGAAVLVLAVCLLTAYGWNAVLDRITRPILEDNDLSAEEARYWATYNPDAPEGDGTAQADNSLSEEDYTAAPPLPPVTGDYITNILIIGQDYRKGEDTKLADSMILCSLNRKNATLTLTSFFRDTFVQIPAYKGHTGGHNRINAVYNLGWKWGGDLGGMEMMNLCMKQNFGIEVDYNVEINFETFIQIIDRLGGVDIDLTEAEVNYLKRDKTGINDWLKPGLNHVEGYTALGYARARKLDNDFNRTGRQRKVVSALLDKFRDKSLKEITEIAWDVLPLVVTNMSNQEITALLKDAVPLLPQLKLNAGTCPAEHTYWGEMMVLGGYPAGVLRFDAAQNRKMMQWICEVPAFEASPDNPPEIIPVPRQTQPPTEPTTEPTVPETEPPATTEAAEQTQSPTETQAPAETQAPTVPESTQAPTEPSTAPTQPSVPAEPTVPPTTQAPPETQAPTVPQTPSVEQPEA